MSDTWTTKDGEVIAWEDLTDCHLWNIVRMMTRVVRDRRRDLTLHWRALDEKIHAKEHIARLLRAYNSPVFRRDLRQSWRRAQRQQLSEDVPKLARAFAEVERRGLMPSADELRVAWDRACGGDGGEDVTRDPTKCPWCLVELWVGYRGESTLSPEYAERQVSA